MADESRFDRLAYLGKLAGGLAHEIKNPLSTIMVNLDLLREDLEGRGESTDKMALRKVEILKQETERLEEMLEDFLSLTKGLEIDASPLNIDTVVEEVLDFVGPELQRRGVEVRKFFDADIPPCKADRNLIKQALLNIVINAKDAMKDGGELMVRTSAGPDSVRISITDTGSGIPDSQLQRIWDPYFTTKKEGSGLGLPTAKRIIEEHGGTIEALSEPGRGSSFTIVLPIGKQ